MAFATHIKNATIRNFLEKLWTGTSYIPKELIEFKDEIKDMELSLENTELRCPSCDSLLETRDGFYWCPNHECGLAPVIPSSEIAQSDKDDPEPSNDPPVDYTEKV